MKLVAPVIIGLTFSLSQASGADSPASTEKLGKKIDKVTLTDAAGKKSSLQDLQGKKATVVVFLSFDCPVSNNYAQPLTQLAKTYGDKGVAFVGLNCAEEDAAQSDKQRRDFAISFQVFKDEKLAAADAFKAEVTPEAFLLDHNLVLRYRGRIDNSYAARLKKNTSTTKNDLKQALDELLAGKPVSEPATKAIGCHLTREAELKETGKVTYYRDVLPIVQNHCQMCHRPGEVGPFSLMTYKQAVNWAADIKEYTQARKMPPWKPVEGPGYLHERKMNDREIATLAAWVDGGTPAGNVKDAPPPRQFVQGWQLGQPDLVLTVDSDFQVASSGADIFRCFVFPTNLPEDKYVRAVEVRPGNPRIVHHTLNFIDTAGQARKLEENEKKREKRPEEIDGGPGYSSAMGVGFAPRGAIGGWAPGQMPRQLPEGAAYFLPKGADVIVQVHYHRNGRLEKDRTSIGLHFAKKPVARRFQSVVVAGGGQGRFRFFAIPPGNSQFSLKGSMWVDQDCTVHSVMPHMHMLGKQIKVAMTPPAGTATTLVAIKDWEYNWQETYFFKDPIQVKAGTRFDIEAIFDNSATNPNNPHNPPKWVTFGQQTTNEMCFGFLGATTDKPGRIRQKFEDPNKPTKVEETKPASETRSTENKETRK